MAKTEQIVNAINTRLPAWMVDSDFLTLHEHILRITGIHADIKEIGEAFDTGKVLTYEERSADAIAD